MLSLEDIKKVKEKWEKKFLGYKNVVGVDIGNKFINHSRTNDLSIRVLVKPNEKGKRIPAGEVIPPIICGVRTDVIERQFGIPMGGTDRKRTGRCRASMEVNNQRLKGGIGTESGTLGMIVRKRGPLSESPEEVEKAEKMFLSCEHVLREHSKGRIKLFDRRLLFSVELESPEKPSGGNKLAEKLQEKFAQNEVTLSQNVTVSPDDEKDGAWKITDADNEIEYYVMKGEKGLDIYSHSNYRISRDIDDTEKKYNPKRKDSISAESETDAESEPEVDCAVVAIKTPSTYTSEIIGIGRIRGVAEAERGMEVRKYGESTGLTYGFVDSVSLTLNIEDGIFFNQIGIVSDLTRNREFGTDGDSGSVIVNNNSEAIGLLIARDFQSGSAKSQGGVYCAATPIQAVLDTLEVDIYEQLLEGLDEDIDESVRAITMPPPPLTEDISRVLYGKLIDTDCCCKCCNG